MKLKLLLIIALMLLVGCSSEPGCVMVQNDNDHSILVIGEYYDMNVTDSGDGDTFQQRMCCNRFVCLGPMK